MQFCRYTPEGALREAFACSSTRAVRLCTHAPSAVRSRADGARCENEKSAVNRWQARVASERSRDNDETRVSVTFPCAASAKLRFRRLVMRSTRKEMMRYLVKTDYLSGSWVRAEEEPLAGVAAAAGALAHLRGELPRGAQADRKSVV